MSSNSSAAASSSSGTAGPFLIAAAAAIWATDVLFRAPLVRTVHPVFIVLFEHLLGTLALGIWAYFRNREQLLAITPFTWFKLVLIGAGGSAIATVLFTASFQHLDNPSVAILLQKLQPVMVVLFALIFLRETPTKSFWAWAPVALLAALVLSFPNFDFHFLSHGIDWHSQGVIYALSAAGLWALTTVAGKSAVNQLPPAVVTFWRYFFGLLTLIVLMIAGGESVPVDQLLQPGILESLVYMALMPGILALVFYYNGLARTTASTATFLELIYPISAIGLSWYFLHDPLSPVQILAALILLFSVTRISLPN